MGYHHVCVCARTRAYDSWRPLCELMHNNYFDLSTGESGSVYSTVTTLYLLSNVLSFTFSTSLGKLQSYKILLYSF